MGLSQEMLVEIVGPMAACQAENFTGSEKRKEQRLQLGTRAGVARLAGARAGTPVKALIVDISPSGMGLLHPEPFQKDEWLLVSLTRRGQWGGGGGGEESILVYGRVVHCKRAGTNSGLFAIGCAFADRPTERPASLGPTGAAEAALRDRIRDAILG